jgi:hypothetical protein
MGLGAASLVLIFAVLCLAVFSLLTLSTANRNRALTQKRVEAMTAFYAADNAAVELVAKLREAVAGGEVPARIGDVEIRGDGQGVYSYSCRIDGRRALAVTLRLADGGLEILAWREMDLENWTPDDRLNVWEGD